MNHHLHLFDVILQSIDNDLWKKILFLFIVVYYLIAKREFHSFDHVLRSVEFVWIYSMSSSSFCQSTMKERGLFSTFHSQGEKANPFGSYNPGGSIESKRIYKDQKDPRGSTGSENPRSGFPLDVNRGSIQVRSNRLTANIRL